MQDNQYIPGVCNIGPHEVEKRMRYAFGYSFVALLFPYFSYLVGFPLLIKLLVFFPAAAAAANILQIYYRFCIYYGFSALFNFGDDKSKQIVKSQPDQQADLKKAKNMLAVAIAIALGYTALIAIFF